MCGICGEVTFGGARPDLSAIQKVSAVLANRGPDSSGLIQRERMVFAHRRLSIIDLSPSADQPMSDALLQMDLVFNGCIYNYKELRQELEDLGHIFFSSSDTEVIIKAHHAWGEKAPERLVGMFAYAIYNRASGSMWLARDRFGVKPLYYTRTPQRLRFASSLPALIAGGNVDTKVDPYGLHHYLSFHGAVPGPRTLLSGVFKLPPATIARIEANGSMQSRRYWTLGYPENDQDKRLSMEEWADRLVPALRTAVRRRLIADVNVGVFLSGGLDSSLIVALLSDLGQRPVRTYSIGFESNDRIEGNEFQYSEIVAREFQTRHEKVVVSSADLMAALPDMFLAMSEPMMSRDCIGFYKISRHVAKEMKVVQCGQGADEMFAGYQFYQEFKDAVDPASQYAATVFDFNSEKISAALTEEWLVDANASSALVSKEMNSIGATDPVNRVLYFHGCVKLAEDQLKRVDDMTMAWGIEARTPFLDHELAELTARIPAGLKLAHGGKGVLKRIARRFLPDEIIERPKGYFPVPEIQYPEGRMLELAQDALNSRAAKERNFFNRSYLEKLFAAPRERHLRSGAAELWYCACLELWLQAHC